MKLLGGMTPTISLEQLVYATRLLNNATKHGPQAALTLRDWFAETDVPYDPQAYVLRPDVVLKLAAEIIAEPTPYRQVRRAAIATLETLRKAYASKEFTLFGREAAWLNSLSAQADELPESEEQMIEQILPQIDREKVRLDQYDIKDPVAA